MAAVVIALDNPHMLIVYGAFAAVYLASIPVVLWAVDRDIDRRTGDSPADASNVDRVARDTGLPRS